MLFISATTAFAQTASEEDLAGIKQAALDYAGSWPTGDPDRTEKALSPDLAIEGPPSDVADEYLGLLTHLANEQVCCAPQV